MCARFALRTTMEVVATLFELEDFPRLVPRFNIPPSSPALVIVGSAHGARQVRFMNWGLVPSWAVDPTIGQRMINARSETAAEKPAFRAALRHRRCLIPADGFFEWRQEGKVKQPYFVEMEDGSPFGFGGLWEAWEGPDGAFESYTILTTAPNHTLEPIHERMPVIVPPAAFELWLDPQVIDPRALAPILAPYLERPMRTFAVDRRVGNPRFDQPEATRPIGPTSLF